MSKFFVFVMVICSFSCKNTSTPKTELAEVTEKAIAVDSSYSAEGKIWLKEVIESHFDHESYALEDICTPEYFQFKSDAVNVGYDGGLSEEEFIGKWKGKFDTQHAGIGLGFFISGQDWGKIEVTQCTPIESKIPETYVYDVIIDDTQFKAKYHRIFTLIQIGKAFQISNVVEFEPDSI